MYPLYAFVELHDGPWRIAEREFGVYTLRRAQHEMRMTVREIAANVALATRWADALRLAA